MNWKNTAISSIKIRFNIARRICYLDSRCTLTVMIPEIMPRSTYSKKIILNNLNWIIACSHINRFLEFAINHEKQLEFQSNNVRNFRSSLPWMTKASSFQTFPIDLFVEEAHHWLYVIIMLSTPFRVNLHFIIAWMPRNSLLKTDAISEV